MVLTGYWIITVCPTWHNLIETIMMKTFCSSYRTDFESKVTCAFLFRNNSTKEGGRIKWKREGEWVWHRMWKEVVAKVKSQDKVIRDEDCDDTSAESEEKNNRLCSIRPLLHNFCIKQKLQSQIFFTRRGLSSQKHPHNTPPLIKSCCYNCFRFVRLTHSYT